MSFWRGPTGFTKDGRGTMQIQPTTARLERIRRLTDTKGTLRAPAVDGQQAHAFAQAAARKAEAERWIAEVRARKDKR